MMIRIEEIKDRSKREEIARYILEKLPEWFGIEESRENYILESKNQFFIAALEMDKPIGFVCLKETGDATVELSVLGILKEYHRKGIGKALILNAKENAIALGYSFLQVKTVQMGKYEEYDRTNLFYQSVGFQEFEVFPTLWGEGNPCQIYVMALK